MLRSPPPFRAEHIGSLLRPPALLAARRAAEEGRLSPEGLRAEEDVHIREAVDLQEAVGLEAITDGEYRRGIYFGHFSDAVEGFTEMDAEMSFRGAGGEPLRYRAAGGDRAAGPPPRDRHRGVPPRAGADAPDPEGHASEPVLAALPPMAPRSVRPGLPGPRGVLRRRGGDLPGGARRARRPRRDLRPARRRAARPPVRSRSTATRSWRRATTPPRCSSATSAW